MSSKTRAPRNRTISLTDEERARHRARLIQLDSPAPVEIILNKTIYQNLFDTLAYLPPQFVDLLFLDPPYNLDKAFNNHSFNQMPLAEYESWLESWLAPS